MKNHKLLSSILFAVAALPAIANANHHPDHEPDLICKNEAGEEVARMLFAAGPRGVDKVEVVQYGQTIVHAVYGGIAIHNAPHTRAGYEKIYRTYLPMELFGTLSISKQFFGPHPLADGGYGYDAGGISGVLIVGSLTTYLSCAEQ